MRHQKCFASGTFYSYLSYPIAKSTCNNGRDCGDWWRNKAVPFSQVDSSDKFFDPRKADYAEFSTWFQKKRQRNETYMATASSGTIDGFLYLKIENDALEDSTPPMPAAKRLKIGTFKINRMAHG